MVSKADPETRSIVISFEESSQGALALDLVNYTSRSCPGSPGDRLAEILDVFVKGHLEVEREDVIGAEISKHDGEARIVFEEREQQLERPFAPVVESLDDQAPILSLEDNRQPLGCRESSCEIGRVHVGSDPFLVAVQVGQQGGPLLPGILSSTNRW